MVVVVTGGRLHRQQKKTTTKEIHPHDRTCILSENDGFMQTHGRITQVPSWMAFLTLTTRTRSLSPVFPLCRRAVKIPACEAQVKQTHSDTFECARRFERRIDHHVSAPFTTCCHSEANVWVTHCWQLHYSPLSPKSPGFSHSLTCLPFVLFLESLYCCLTLDPASPSCPGMFYFMSHLPGYPSVPDAAFSFSSAWKAALRLCLDSEYTCTKVRNLTPSRKTKSVPIHWTLKP